MCQNEEENKCNIWKNETSSGESICVEYSTIYALTLRLKLRDKTQ